MIMPLLYSPRTAYLNSVFSAEELRSIADRMDFDEVQQILHAVLPPSTENIHSLTDCFEVLNDVLEGLSKTSVMDTPALVHIRFMLPANYKHSFFYIGNFTK